jgi:hypothetical protein
MQRYRRRVAACAGTLYVPFTRVPYNGRMPPSDALVVSANAALEDPNVQASIRQMHAEGLPLVQMVEALGLGGTMSPRIRQILEGLPPDVVEGIRRATLTALQNPLPTLPVDCRLTEPEIQQPVVVEVVPEGGAPTIRVQLAPN